MEVVLVKDELVCSRRVPGLQSASLRVVQNSLGVLLVATDAVSAPLGKWVLTNTGSAARLSMSDPTVITDLTICGIIDHWDP